MNLAAGLAGRFASHFGRKPGGVVFAPGRVNLIGDHVDYCDGLVLPMPISLGTWVAWAPRSDRRIAALALDYGGAMVEFGLTETCGPRGDWSDYVRGMAVSCGEAGLPALGADLAIAGDLPRGAGLSSSASLCIASGRALAAAAGSEAPPARQLALAAQHTEHVYVGVRCGIMDQMAIAAGAPGSALLLDCRSLETRSIALPPDWVVLIVQSGVERGLVDGQYNARRRDCEAAAAALGYSSLRDCSMLDAASPTLPPQLARRARHVVGEITRVSEAAEALATADLPRLGAMMRASHASLRDDFEVSHPSVDRLVEDLNSLIGELGGARMTGGGFGGAVVAIVSSSRAPVVIADLRAAGWSGKVLVEPAV